MFPTFARNQTIAVMYEGRWVTWTEWLFAMQPTPWEISKWLERYQESLSKQGRTRTVMNRK